MKSDATAIRREILLVISIQQPEKNVLVIIGYVSVDVAEYFE